MGAVLFTGFLNFLFIFVSSEETITADFLKTAVLTCPLSQDIRITFWTGPPGDTIYNYPSSLAIIETVPNADRLEINKTNAELMIHNVTLEDQGLYRCSAALLGSADLRLQVTNVPPSRIYVEDTEQRDKYDVIHRSEDDSLTLKCLTDGAKPEPNITWTRSDTQETLNSISSIRMYENGTSDISASTTFTASRELDGVLYVCTVEHPTLEWPVQTDVKLHLDLKPLMKETGKSIKTTEGFNTTISCEVFGARPAANLSIYIVGDIHSGFNKNTIVYNQTSDTYTTRATFHRLMDRKDNGKMVACFVEHFTLLNGLNKTWSIVVNYPPSATISYHNVTSLVQTLSMKCLAESGNPENFTFSLWQHRWASQSNILRELDSTSNENNKATLQLENITFQDSGYYKCFVSNGIGTRTDGDYMATDEVFVVIKDDPYVVDGHTEYFSSTDEMIEILLDVYTNVEPLHVSIERKMEATPTTAIWTIKENLRQTVGVPVYNHQVLVTGYRIAADFEVQTKENYGDYKFVIRNEIGTTRHYFKVLPKVSGGTPTEKINVFVIVAAVVAPIVVISVLVAIVSWCKCRRKKQSTNHNYSSPSPDAGKNPTGTGTLYDYINPGGEGFINPIRANKPTDRKDSGYLKPTCSYKVECWEYSKGDEKVTYRRVEGTGPRPIDFDSTNKMLCLPMSEAAHYENLKELEEPQAGPSSADTENIPESSAGYIQMTDNTDIPDLKKKPHVDAPKAIPQTSTDYIKMTGNPDGPDSLMDQPSLQIEEIPENTDAYVQLSDQAKSTPDIEEVE